MHNYLRFDEKGTLTAPVPAIPTETTDLVILSHGWNNDDQDCRELYDGWSSAYAVGPASARKPFVLCVRWPSKKFNVQVNAPVQPLAPGAAMAVGHVASSGGAALAVVDELRALFEDAAAVAILDKAAAVAPRVDLDAASRKEYIDCLRGLARIDGQSLADDEDDLSSENQFFHLPVQDLVSELESQAPLVGAAGGAEGSVEAMFLGGVGAALGYWPRRIGNYLTYFTMKNRAGVVGKVGLAPLLETFAALPHLHRIHLAGHSFGARLVTAASAVVGPGKKLHSMCLVQAAFSHNAFSKSRKGAFRSIVTQHVFPVSTRITHTHNDKATLLAYPAASRISRDAAAAMAIGGPSDEFGALGANGAQRMETGEVAAIDLPAEGGAYPAGPEPILNLKADAAIADHNAVVAPATLHMLTQSLLAG